MKKTLILLALFVTFNACKKTETTPILTPTVVLSCRITQMVKNNGSYDFSYDSKGNVSKYSLTTSAGTDKQVLTHVFAYNVSNQLTSVTQTFAINGKSQGSSNIANLTYSGELLTGQSYMLAGGTSTFATATLKYDTNKRLVERNYTNNTSNYASVEKYEYDSNGNCTRYLIMGSDKSSDEFVFAFDSSKNPEQIIAKILPYDFATGLIWNNNMVLTLKETYDYGPGDMGVATGKRTNIKADTKGFVVSSTYTEDANNVTNETYS